MQVYFVEEVMDIETIDTNSIAFLSCGKANAK